MRGAFRHRSFPNFRMFSVGRRGRAFFPDDSTNKNRCAATPSWSTPPGDNCRYFTYFRYKKTTSRVDSSYVRVFSPENSGVTFASPIVLPAAADQPQGTKVELLYEGARNANGRDHSGFSVHPAVANGLSNLAFRAIFHANPDTGMAPLLDLVAIPYRR